MANKFFLQDNGDVIFYNNEIWSKVGTSTSNSPNATMGGNDVGNIVGYTFNLADFQGRTVYSAEEIGKAEEGIGLFTVTIPFPLSNWYTLVASSPEAGVIRVWNNGNQNRSVRVNGVVVATHYYNSKADAVGVNIGVGDLVEVNGELGDPDKTATGMLIPFSYTNPGV